MAKKPAPHNKKGLYQGVQDRAANQGYNKTSDYTTGIGDLNVNPANKFDARNQAVDWFRKNLRKTVVSPSRLIREEQDNLVNSWRNLKIGDMAMFMYDPKWKKELPYYDAFPLIIKLSNYPDGGLGINLHYLPPVLRAKLYKELLNVQNNAHYTDNKRFVVTYKILQSAAEKFSGYSPCVKRYLSKHVRSRFIKVPYDKWTASVFLPTETFIKASKEKVWRDSRGMI